MAIDKSVFWTDRYYKKSSLGWKCNICFHESVVVGDIRKHIQMDHYDYYNKLLTDADMMGHSIKTQQKNYMKKYPSEEYYKRFCLQKTNKKK